MKSNYTKRILWAFVMECLLLVAILLLLDRFPAWVLRTMALVAISLPIICALTIAAKPKVYRTWLMVLRELRLGVVAGFCWLWSCISIKNTQNLARHVRAMNICPTTADDWLALVFFPFKAYVLMAFPFLWVCHAIGTLYFSLAPRLNNFAAAAPISAGYALCLPVLLIGALLQALISKQGRSTQTVIVFLLGLLIFWTMPRALAGR